MKYEEIFEFDTKLTADVVDWRPIMSYQNKQENVLACGTYFLDKEHNQRLGYLYLLNVDQETKSCQVLNTLNFETSGILDLKWTDMDHIIAVDSNNILKFLFYEQLNHSFETLTQFDMRKDNESSIGLTLDFLKQSDTNLKALTSDTLGNLTLFSIENERELNLVRSFKAHDYEAWSVLIDRNDSNVIYSGADDCALKMWDLRESASKMANKCSIFEGGVCSILLPQRSDLSCLEGYSVNNLLCGSYDERIYVLDKRNMKRSVNESKKLDGGVWKMKCNAEKNLILCACMHTGVHIVDAKSLSSVLYYDKHGLNNLVYGCDWSPKNNEEFDIVATCSFYNHNLRVWKVIY